jgi:pimeloyl-ACP methyl ester carboxylesterase
LLDATVAIVDVNGDDLPFEQLTVPTLVVAAADSTLPRPQDVAAVLARLPDGRVLAPATGGHLLLGNADRLRSEITEFVTRS